jgi:hypothetical protein
VCVCVCVLVMQQPDYLCVCVCVLVMQQLRPEACRLPFHLPARLLDGGRLCDYLLRPPPRQPPTPTANRQAVLPLCPPRGGGPPPLPAGLRLQRRDVRLRAAGAGVPLGGGVRQRERLGPGLVALALDGAGFRGEDRVGW